MPHVCNVAYSPRRMFGCVYACVCWAYWHVLQTRMNRSRCCVVKWRTRVGLTNRMWVLWDGWDDHWRLANRPNVECWMLMRGGDASSCQITLAACYFSRIVMRRIRCGLLFCCVLSVCLLVSTVSRKRNGWTSRGAVWDLDPVSPRNHGKEHFWSGSYLGMPRLAVVDSRNVRPIC